METISLEQNADIFIETSPKKKRKNSTLSLTPSPCDEEKQTQKRSRIDSAQIGFKVSSSESLNKEIDQKCTGPNIDNNVIEAADSLIGLGVNPSSNDSQKLRLESTENELYVGDSARAVYYGSLTESQSNMHVSSIPAK